MRPTPEPTAERRNGRVYVLLDDVDFKTRRCVVASWREENDGRLLRAECDSTTKGESRAYVLFDNVDFKLRRCAK